jgi:hypothetical protein
MSLEEYERHYFQCVRSYPFKKIHNLIVTKIIDHRNFEKVQKSFYLGLILYSEMGGGEGLVEINHDILILDTFYIFYLYFCA